MIEETSFKCLLDVFCPVLPRDIFRNPIQAVNYFPKKAPSSMFEWDLNRPWTIMSKVYGGAFLQK